MSYINILSQVLVPTKLSLPISCATLGTFCSWMISEKTRQTDKMKKKKERKKIFVLLHNCSCCGNNLSAVKVFQLLILMIWPIPSCILLTIIFRLHTMLKIYEQIFTDAQRAVLHQTRAIWNKNLYSFPIHSISRLYL